MVAIPAPVLHPEYQRKTALEVNGASTVLKEVLDGVNMTMASTVFSDPVVVDKVKNPPAVAQFILKINVPIPLPPPLPYPYTPHVTPPLPKPLPP